MVEVLSKQSQTASHINKNTSWKARDYLKEWFSAAAITIAPTVTSTGAILKFCWFRMQKEVILQRSNSPGYGKLQLEEEDS